MCFVSTWKDLMRQQDHTAEVCNNKLTRDLVLWYNLDSPYGGAAFTIWAILHKLLLSRPHRR